MHGASPAVGALVVSTLLVVVCGDQNDFLDMRVSAQSGCGPVGVSSDTWRAVELVQKHDVPFVRDPCNPECATTIGIVTVHRTLEGPLQVFGELRLGLDANAAPEPCHGFDKRTGCGGFGSCLYCGDDSCNDQEMLTSARIELHWEGEDITCLKQLDAGVYDNVQLRVCMPTVKQFFDALESRGVSRGSAKALLDEENEIGFFMHMYLFSGDIKSQLMSHHRLWQFMLDHGTGANDDKCFRSMPFIRKNVHNPKTLGGYGARYHCRGDRDNEVTDDEEDWKPGYVGCHTLSGALVVPITPQVEERVRERPAWCPAGRSTGGRKTFNSGSGLRDRTARTAHWRRLFDRN